MPPLANLSLQKGNDTFHVSLMFKNDECISRMLICISTSDNADLFRQHSAGKETKKRRAEELRNPFNRPKSTKFPFKIVFARIIRQSAHKQCTIRIPSCLLIASRII